jgi:hypothetical protein
MLPHIPTQYNEGMWQTNIEAIKGSAGIWSHVSYRSDKSEIFQTAIQFEGT